jgi:hypothetical protein
MKEWALALVDGRGSARTLHSYACARKTATVATREERDADGRLLLIAKASVADTSL